VRFFSDADGLPDGLPPALPRPTTESMLAYLCDSAARVAAAADHPPFTVDPGHGGWAVVSSAELGALDADYYVNREDGESPAHYRRRTQALDAIRRAEGHERHAAALRADAAALLAGDDQ